MPTDAEYQRLLAFRTRLRRFDQWSRQAAEQRGLTHAQHQLLLAVRGSGTGRGPTIGDVADALMVKHHTATGLVDRTQELGLVERVRDADDSRRVHLRLTRKGHRILRELTDVHLEELRRLGPMLGPMLDPLAEPIPGSEQVGTPD
ncbi:MarR family winged helix-turn-helix transcriptional regulator [Nocardioides terrisoli]|uniref:MarR family winged helix-turn-helix transcriptional regulator n=1 Tax=Nocardioides terrisoli TaxID=3388267 RepID=UPI00287BAD1A|nr:MarR family winged helix-turn-helix transcriptional regulator [Nocardioides marmorisolisilvae]